MKILNRENLHENIENALTSDRTKVTLSMRHIESVHVHQNEVQQLSIFAGLGDNSIRCVDLSFNLIASIKYAIFVALDQLEQINLNNNRIAYLDSNLFQGLFSLKHLNLALNKLSSLDSNMFVDAVNLTELNLSFNRLLSINDKLFKSCVSLRLLRLDGNRLEYLPPHAFENLTRLSRLYLSYNRIETLSRLTIYNCVNLAEIYLNNNRLHTIEADLFNGCSKKLLKVDFSNNSIKSAATLISSLSKCEHLGELGLLNNPFDDSIQSYLTSSSIQRIWVDLTQAEKMKTEYLMRSDLQKKIIIRENFRVFRIDSNESEHNNVEHEDQNHHHHHHSHKILTHASSSSNSLNEHINNHHNNQDNHDDSVILFKFVHTHYRTLDKLGSGSFGNVYLVKDLNDNKLKAIKVMPNSLEITDGTSDDGKSRHHMSMGLHEIEMLKKLNNDHIVKYYDCFSQGHFICIVLEFCEKKDLGDFLLKRKELKKPLKIKSVCEWSRQIVSALDCLHSHKIVHRDVKPNNIFVTIHNQLKLGDLGTAKLIVDVAKPLHTFVGTISYLSPEVLKNEGYTFKTDVWALGCVIYEMIKLRKLFDFDSMAMIVTEIVEREIVFDKNDEEDYLIDETMKALLSSMLKKKPDERPCSHDLLKRFEVILELL